jgi:hypothetical protein
MRYFSYNEYNPELAVRDLLIECREILNERKN